eukprot:TRINITY_DN217_c0_g1_i1.p1 TRINITY_DN217_c0_g1~~TRINITY_DN217_c0_g1_i1.p1  ORF type:complete len:114 (-),score=5.25 TRINITY_DN217_c0_g1_i1:51-392(-)
MSSPIIARRLEQQAKVRLLYRRALKTVQSWAVHRDTFYNEAMKTRAEFEQHKNVTNLDLVDRLIDRGEAKLREKAHPDPYIIPWAVGGSKYQRNPPVPTNISFSYDFGKETYT